VFLFSNWVWRCGLSWACWVVKEKDGLYLIDRIDKIVLFNAYFLPLFLDVLFICSEHPVNANVRPYVPGLPP
jgi:hypothetical protein